MKDKQLHMKQYMLGKQCFPCLPIEDLNQRYSITCLYKPTTLKCFTLKYSLINYNISAVKDYKPSYVKIQYKG